MDSGDWAEDAVTGIRRDTVVKATKRKLQKKPDGQEEVIASRWEAASVDVMEGDENQNGKDARGVISLLGRRPGRVKQLSGFRKGVHTVPGAVTAAAEAFLAKLCAGELAEETEALFREARTAFGYKRREISVDITGSMAQVIARDFRFEIVYALDESDPAAYVVARELSDLAPASEATWRLLDGLFPLHFSILRFPLGRPVAIEAMIDAIEDLEGAHGMSVDYPPDCGECTIRVAGVETEVLLSGPFLDLRFPGETSPSGILRAFLDVRAAFQASGSTELGHLL